MYLFMLSLPILGATVGGFLGRFLGPRGSGIVTISCMGAALCCALLSFYEVGVAGSPCYLRIADWLRCEMLDVSWGFQFDSLTTTMLVVVISVSFLVHIYSTSYMSHDPHQPRFMAYLSLFTFFMLLLVSGDNLIVMFLGWEGVGLCSYLLINFWFTRVSANKAAMKAMIVNRVGDFGFALGILALYYVFQSVNFSTIFGMVPSMSGSLPFFPAFFDANFGGMEDSVLGNAAANAANAAANFDWMSVICLCLFVGAVGKSAQVGLHTWLPDAMEGPTPVSALIHAATMVTAGVFMIIRCSPLFERAPIALVVVTVMGAMTAFFAATTGLLQNDLKKVIAYSTCSQLGYMVFACGLSNYSVSIFHLANHAYFKALLFLSAGSVIHALADEQDMRLMGGLRQILPYTYTAMVIGSLSLMGFPFLTGFYSKDMILELAYASYSCSGSFAHWLGCISAFFTSFYSLRLLYLTFLRDTNAFRSTLEHAHDAPFALGLPLFVLSLGSIFVGYLTKDMMIGLGTTYWGNAIFTLPEHSVIIDSEVATGITLVKLTPVLLSIFGACLAVFLYTFGFGFLYRLKAHTAVGRHLYIFLNKKWLFDKVYNDYLLPTILRFGYSISFKLLDKGLIELFGPVGFANTFKSLAGRFSAFQSGYLSHAAFVMFLGLAFFLAYLCVWPLLGSFVNMEDSFAFITPRMGMVFSLAIFLSLLYFPTSDSVSTSFDEKKK
jgi:NADH-ubiquinone oxidoreductase chain 5